ncbi:hypothetical protein AVEN_52275-1 [Araneus ventricosus]|uniref:Uncharacterized protein n=1 Tax=Araneus ventricosus TaxID=182803 RepID=A0A4Y2LPM4_ARAVE|nr:hypothetical protein AVEN_52275-1 [Araneus ventricosus]
MAHLNYNPLSLKDMAIRRLASVLFKESNILASISNFHCKFSLCDEVWRETVEDKLPDEISKLGLPKSLTKLLIDTVKPMGLQVGRWKEFHEEYLHDSHGEEIHFDVPILEKLRWTTAGAVDYRKTAEELVRSDVIDIVKRYKLSCLYCMEDYIPMFWKELPKDNKRYFCRKTERCFQSGGLGLEFWWPYIIKGQESNLDNLTRSYRRNQITFHQYAFQCSAEKGNKTAVEYFFQQLTHGEKEVSLMSATRSLLTYDYTTRNYLDREDDKEFPSVTFSELLSYLLSVMTPDQQMRIFQEQPCEILEWFLEWPFQDIFTEIADLIWDFLPERDYNFVLRRIHGQFKDSDYYCLKLFQEFFLRIPSDFWKSFVDRQCEFDSPFYTILLEQDIKALEIIFKCLDAGARARLVFSEPALETFHYCISIGKWDVVEVCIREASLSQEDRKRLKEAFTGYLTSIGEGAMKLKTRKWSRFFHLLDNTNDPIKRCSEDRRKPKKEKLSYEE